MLLYQRRCATSDDCTWFDNAFCNFDNGEGDGICQGCPGKTSQDCIDAALQNQLGTRECRIACDDELSKWIKGDWVKLHFFIMERTR